MRVPKQFKLAGSTINVVLDPNLLSVFGALGQSCYNTNTIKINDGGVPQDAFEQTFCHELVHMILHMMSEEELRGNEKFVDLFGHFLHQALTTQKGSHACYTN